MGVTVNVDDPELCTKKKVDGSGKVYVGNDLADEEITIVVSRGDGCSHDSSE